ncbi:MAG: diguanylate cyclase [Thermodesulfobacteriota bacterium]
MADSKKNPQKNLFSSLFSSFIRTCLDTSITGKLIGMLIVSLLGFSIIYIHETIALHMIKQRVESVRGINMPQYKVCQLTLRGLNGFKISLLHTLNLHEEDESADYSNHIQDNFNRINNFRHMLETLKSGGTIQDVTQISNLTLDSFQADPAPTDSEQYIKIEQISYALEMLQDSYSQFVQVLHNGHSEDDLDSTLEDLLDSLDTVYSELTELSLLVNQEFSGQVQATEDIIQRASRHFLAICLATVIILLSGTAIYILIIVRPLKNILEKIKQIAKGGGDLSMRIDAKTHDEVGQLARQLNNLVDNIHSLNSFKAVIEEEESPTDVHIRLASIIADRFELDCFFSYEVNDIKKTISVAHACDHQLLCSQKIMDDCNLCRAKRTGHYISSLQYPHICKFFPHRESHDHFCIPMIAGGRVIGVMQFLLPKGSSKEATARFEEQVEHAWRYIREATPVIEAKRFAAALRETTLKDPMTDLYNRRFLESYMETLIANSKRRKSNIGILMCDMDFFKEVNDTYGHEAGDSVIVKTAEILTSCVRTSDLVIRYGGEEFLVLLLDVKSQEDTAHVAEKIRSSMEATEIQLPGGKTLQKTISVGYSVFPSDSDAFWECIKYADVALYQAKEDGRNLVREFKPEMWQENLY